MDPTERAVPRKRFRVLITIDLEWTPEDFSMLGPRGLMEFEQFDPDIGYLLAVAQANLPPLPDLLDIDDESVHVSVLEMRGDTD